MEIFHAYIEWKIDGIYESSVSKEENGNGQRRTNNDEDKCTNE
jgi:hypothetical protein